MGRDSRIGWTRHTFNWLRGCVRVHGSPACEAPDGGIGCYAEMMAKRNPKLLGEWGPQANRVIAGDEYWDKPLAWDRAAAEAGEIHLVFTTAFGDLFEGRSVPCPGCGAADPLPFCRHCHGTGWMELSDGVRPDYVPHLHRLWKLMHRTRNLWWQPLTKRVTNAVLWGRANGWPENAMFGFTAETQELYDERAAEAMHIPVGATRFASLEPMVEAIDPFAYLSKHQVPTKPHQTLQPNGLWRRWHGVDWVISGCASRGVNADKRRPYDPEWARLIRDRCAEGHVPFFYKQAADVRGKIEHGPMLDGRDHLELPIPTWTDLPVAA